MPNVYSYFGIQDVHDLAERVLKGDAADLGSRAKMHPDRADGVWLCWCSWWRRSGWLC